MEKYNLEQTGQEVQNILNEATTQSELTAETERAQLAEQQLQNDIDAIEEKIPSGASSSNKLATEEYVDDSVSTATATFRGTFNLVSDLGLTVDATEQQIAAALASEISTADNNDYCFVQIPTSDETPTEIEEIDRYKFNGTAWSFEYELNNSGFTADQWDAINSHITSGDVAKLLALPTNAELNILLNGKQDVLTFDNVPTENSNNPVKSGGVKSAIDDEKGARINSDTALQQAIDGINGKIPSDASSENKLATASDVDDEATARSNADQSLQDAIEAILLLIPTAASSLNQLADKAFVNSSIATNTATFRGTFNLVNDLHLTLAATHAQVGNALALAILESDNNDYAFVQIPTVETAPNEIAQTDRYKFNGSTWEYEYTLNNSGFTSAQWIAINSGITSVLVSKLSALPTNSELTSELGALTTAINNINLKIPAAAAQNNKLVDTAALESYIIQVLDVLTVTYNITSSDGHVTFHIEQTDGKITAVTLTTNDIASANDLTVLAGRVTTAENDIDALEFRVGTNEADIALLQAAYGALTQSDIIVGALPASGVANKIYRVPGTSSYSDYMWNGTQFVLMATYNNAIDPRPKKASQNLVTSGGVFDNMGALDISELNATENPHTLATYADLSAALAAIPSNDYKKGGMSIKFVQSSDNNYVQYRYRGVHVTGTPNPFLNVANWQGIDDKPTINSANLVTSGGVAALINSGYLYAGVVAKYNTISPNPGKKIFYIGQESGVYDNFPTSFTVPQNSIGVFRFDTSWRMESVKVVVKDLLNIHYLTGDDTAYTDKQTARQSFSSTLMKVGLKITYKYNDSVSTKWVTEQYIGADTSSSNWNNANNWVDYELRLSDKDNMFDAELNNTAILTKGIVFAASSTVRDRRVKTPYLKSPFKLVINSNYEFNGVAWYSRSLNGDFTYVNNQSITGDTFEAPNDSYYYLIEIKKSDNTVITDLSNIISSYQSRYSLDKQDMAQLSSDVKQLDSASNGNLISEYTNAVIQINKSITPAPSWKLSAPFTLYKGTKISIYTGGAGVAALGRCNQDGTINQILIELPSYAPLSECRLYEYTALYDMSVRACYKYTIEGSYIHYNCLLPSNELESKTYPIIRKFTDKLSNTESIITGQPYRNRIYFPFLKGDIVKFEYSGVSVSSATMYVMTDVTVVLAQLTPNAKSRYITIPYNTQYIRLTSQDTSLTETGDITFTIYKYHNINRGGLYIYPFSCITNKPVFIYKDAVFTGLKPLDNFEVRPLQGGALLNYSKKCLRFLYPNPGDQYVTIQVEDKDGYFAQKQLKINAVNMPDSKLSNTNSLDVLFLGDSIIGQNNNKIGLEFRRMLSTNDAGGVQSDGSILLQAYGVCLNKINLIGEMTDGDNHYQYEYKLEQLFTAKRDIPYGDAQGQTVGYWMEHNPFYNPNSSEPDEIGEDGFNKRVDFAWYFQNACGEGKYPKLIYICIGANDYGSFGNKWDDNSYLANLLASKIVKVCKKIKSACDSIAQGDSGIRIKVFNHQTYPLSCAPTNNLPIEQARIVQNTVYDAYYNAITSNSNGINGYVSFVDCASRFDWRNGYDFSKSATNVRCVNEDDELCAESIHMNPVGAYNYADCLVDDFLADSYFD